MVGVSACHRAVIKIFMAELGQVHECETDAAVIPECLGKPGGIRYAVPFRQVVVDAVGDFQHAPEKG